MNLKFIPAVPGYFPQGSEVCFYVQIGDRGQLEMEFYKLWYKPGNIISGTVYFDDRGVMQMDYDPAGWTPHQVEQVRAFAQCLKPTGTRWVRASDYQEITPGLRQCVEAVKEIYEKVQDERGRSLIADVIFNLLHALAWLDRRTHEHSANNWAADSGVSESAWVDPGRTGGAGRAVAADSQQY